MFEAVLVQGGGGTKLIEFFDISYGTFLRNNNDVDVDGKPRNWTPNLVTIFNVNKIIRRISVLTVSE